MALQTGYLKEEALDYVSILIIVDVVINITIQVGLIMKTTVVKIFKALKAKYDNFKYKKQLMI